MAGRMKTWALSGLMATLAMSGFGTADAQTRIRQTQETAVQPATLGDIEGWQVGIWGAPGAHRWAVDRNGRGTISVQGPARTGGRRSIAQRFVLTQAEHRRFVSLIGSFITGPQDVGPCATDQAQDIIQWTGGTRAAGLFNFDHGCRDSASTTRLALLTGALAILRGAAARHAST